MPLPIIYKVPEPVPVPFCQSLKFAIWLAPKPKGV